MTSAPNSDKRRTEQRTRDSMAHPYDATENEQVKPAPNEGNC